MSEALVLEGVFRELCRLGLALSVRDYVDALSALRAGCGVGSKAALVRLCQSLWARSDDEDRLVQAVVDKAARLTKEERQDVEAGLRETGSAEAAAAASERRGRGDEPAQGEADARVRMRFTSTGDGGLPLPRATATGTLDEAFLLSERPPIGERAMAIGWRRFYRPARGGPPSELDVDATVEAKARTGVLAEPVFVPARVNRARVVVAIDTSPSMVAWRRYAEALQRSLHQGRFASTEIFYFENVPGELWRKETFEGQVDLPRALAALEGSALLVFSDGGAARGHRRPDRAGDTKRFFDAVAARLRPIVWLNPTPRPRWRGTTAELIARDSRVSHFTADASDFTRAIDALRGRA